MSKFLIITGLFLRNRCWRLIIGKGGSVWSRLWCSFCQKGRCSSLLLFRVVGRGWRSGILGKFRIGWIGSGSSGWWGSRLGGRGLRRWSWRRCWSCVVFSECWQLFICRSWGRINWVWPFISSFCWGGWGTIGWNLWSCCFWVFGVARAWIWWGSSCWWEIGWCRHLLFGLWIATELVVLGTSRTWCWRNWFCRSWGARSWTGLDRKCSFLWN